MQAVLVMFRNDGERRSFSISREMMVIGRRQDCDLMIPLGEISRKHCRILRDGDTLRLEDLGSSNGTFHNGRRVQEAVLEPGDTVQVGPVSFVVQVDGVPSDDEIQPNTKGGVAIGEDDELETLGDDELSAAPGNDLDDELEPLADDELTSANADDELEALGLDEDDAPKPRRAAKAPADDDELEVLSEDTSGGGPGLDLDAEISENLALGDEDDENKIDMTDSEAGEITIDEKPKRRK
jgi:pSer/pThr/pTyr-binding forkhead associated (FHA) protein